MKKIVFILFLVITAIVSAQKENSLLWKISGNGLEKDSYLFGTMHVSERIAFHLDDVFYESLLKADYIALESNPEKWLDYTFESGELLRPFNLTPSSDNFYNKAFKFEAPKTREMALFLSQENNLINGILYRTNPMTQDFQEETYLDMFIFQTGNKYGKTVIGLEDIERSSNLVKKAVTGRFRKDSPDLWLQKLMKEKSFTGLTSDSYRDRNVSFLDSLNKGMYNEKYMENMLYIRNEDMVKGIDSLAQLGSTFSAVGAAHLGGEKGVIQKLIDRGYTVTPLLSEKTDKGTEIKKQIKSKKAEITYSKRVSSDGFFSVNSTSELYEIGSSQFTVYISPNIRNGAYHTIARINRMNYFGGKIESLQGIDRILFENIPGNIISKKEITKGGFKGLDIVNKTKIGDFQRYQIFMTPLEVFIFKMAGKRDYVISKGDQFFDSIEFLKVTEDRVVVSPKYKGFQIEMPKSHTINNIDKHGSRFIQATDAEGNYYFLKEVVLNDVEYIEEDDFELKRIHERFYKNRELSFDEGAFSGSGASRTYISKSKISSSGNYTHLKTVIRAGHYYLIGMIRADSVTPKAYFDSFKFTPFQYNEQDFEIRKDTALQYSVNTIVAPYYEQNSFVYQSNKEKKEPYEAYSKETSYATDTNERIEVRLKKFHDWKHVETIDSLWSQELLKYQMRRFSLAHVTYDEDLYSSILKGGVFLIKDKKTGKDKFGNETLSVYLQDSLSNRAVKMKQIYKQGKLYTLKTLVDTRFEESKFVKEFYESFQPESDPKSKVNLFQNKINLFVDAVKKGDSVIFKSYRQVRFGKKHEQLLIDLFEDKNIPKNQKFIKTYLLGQISKLNSKKVDAFLEKVYNESFNNPLNQLAIFGAIAEKKNKASYQKLLQLLDTDIPITSSSSDIESIFRKIDDSLALAKDMYPELLTYTAIESYKEPVYDVLTQLLDEDLVKPKIYKKYVKKIQTEARIEIKKQLSESFGAVGNESFSSITSRTNYGYSNENKELLQLYIKLLIPYTERKGVGELLDKIKLIDDTDIKITYIAARAKAKLSVDSKMVAEIIKDYKGHYQLYKKLKKVNRLDILPKSYREKDSVYKSYILKGRYLSEKDSVVFIGKKEFVHKQKPYEVYFYKTKKEQESEYRSSKWQLSYAIFKKDEGKIVEKSTYSGFNKFIDETQPIEDQLELCIEKFRLRSRKRVDLSLNKKEPFGLY